MRMLVKLCLPAALLLPALCFARDVAIIAYKDNASSAVNSADLVKLLKTDSPKWADGTKVVIILGDPGSLESHLLLEKVLRVAPSEMAAFLAAHKNSITVLSSDDLVLKAVAAHPGAIGVVNVYSINSAVKVLRVDGKLPLEQGYLLHGN